VGERYIHGLEPEPVVLSPKEQRAMTAVVAVVSLAAIASIVAYNAARQWWPALVAVTITAGLVALTGVYLARSRQREFGSVFWLPFPTRLRPRRYR
jgi:uncharacterized membrane protein YfcA